MEAEQAATSKIPFYRRWWGAVQRRRLLQKWWFWMILVGGLSILGGGSFLIYWSTTSSKIKSKGRKDEEDLPTSVNDSETENSSEGLDSDYMHPDQKAYNDCKQVAMNDFFGAAKAAEPTAKQQLITVLNKCIKERPAMAVEGENLLQKEITDTEKSFEFRHILHQVLFLQRYPEFEDTDAFWNATAEAMQQIETAIEEAPARQWSVSSLKPFFAEQVLLGFMGDVRRASHCARLLKAFRRLHGLTSQMTGDVKIVAKMCELAGQAINKAGADYLVNLSVEGRDNLERLRGVKDIEALLKARGYRSLLGKAVMESRVLCEEYLNIMPLTPLYDQQQLLQTFEAFAKRTNADPDADDRRFLKETLKVSEKHFAKEALTQALAA
jgi:hypothetical protein